MLCQNCKKREATVHLTEIVNNTKNEIHLCEECAQAKGVAIKAQIEGLDIPEFFGQLAESGSKQLAKKEVAGQGARCSNCGLSFEDFRQGGKFGCPQCFASFRDSLLGLLDRIHGSTQHRGKLPRRASRRISHQKEIMELKEELKNAVSQEAYERAAELRDKLRKLEAGVGSPGRQDKGKEDAE